MPGVHSRVQQRVERERGLTTLRTHMANGSLAPKDLLFEILEPLRALQLATWEVAVCLQAFLYGDDLNVGVGKLCLRGTQARRALEGTAPI